MNLKIAFCKLFRVVTGFEVIVKIIRELPTCFQFTYECNGGMCSHFVSKVKGILELMPLFPKEATQQMQIICKKYDIKGYFQTGLVDAIVEEKKIQIRYSSAIDRWIVKMYNPNKEAAFISFEDAVKFAISR